MLAVLSSFLLATAAFIPGAEASLKSSSKKGVPLKSSSKGTRYGTTYKGSGVKKTHTTKESSVECHAVATATSYSYSANGFAYAMADAFKYACSKRLDDDWKVMVDYMHDYDDAYAFAYAATSADVHCKSKGNAYGCALAHANAKAWAKATLRVWASAWATAINECKCKGKTNEAIVDEYGSAHEFERLIANVESESHAYVCVDGDDEAWASAYSYCLHDIYAVGFAKAFAYALIDGECYAGDYEPGLIAAAKIEAKARIDRWDYIDC